MEQRKKGAESKFFSDPTEQYDRIGRFRPKMLRRQMYFQFMICQKNFHFFEEINEYIENYYILLKNRLPAKIYVLTSNTMRLVSAMH